MCFVCLFFFSCLVGLLKSKTTNSIPKYSFFFYPEHIPVVRRLQATSGFPARFLPYGSVRWSQAVVNVLILTHTQTRV